MRLLFAILALCCSTNLAIAGGFPSAESYLATTTCAEGGVGEACRYARALWPKSYAAAIAGSYQGQRNIAYCLSTGCNGAVARNAILGCAWRTVIIRSGHRELNRSDLATLRYFCGPQMLGAKGRQAALDEAGKLLDLLGIFRKA